jgi:hypothetical protein
MIWMLSLVKTASKARVNALSRSRIKNRSGVDRAPSLDARIVGAADARGRVSL